MMEGKAAQTSHYPVLKGEERCIYSYTLRYLDVTLNLNIVYGCDFIPYFTYCQ